MTRSQTMGIGLMKRTWPVDKQEYDCPTEVVAPVYGIREHSLREAGTNAVMLCGVQNSGSMHTPVACGRIVRHKRKH